MGVLAYEMIKTHIKECADNYRSLTHWVMATLVAGLGAAVLLIVNLIVMHGTR